MSGVSVTNWSGQYTPGKPFQEGQQEDQRYAGRMMLEKIFFFGAPRQAEVAQGVPSRLRPRISWRFGTTMVVGRQPNAPAAFTPGEIPGTHFQRLSRPQGTWFCAGVPRKKSPMTPPGIDPGTVRLVAQRLNHYATPGPRKDIQKSKVPNWKTLVQVRRSWKELVEKAKILHKEL
jgi:hypothetical protein